MIVLVCGGRHYKDKTRVFSVLDGIHKNTPIATIVHGACGMDEDDALKHLWQLRGADALADAWATSRGVMVHRVPAWWSRLGAKAGPTRNSGMLAYQPDLVVAFPGGRGTADMVRKARNAGVTVLTVPAVKVSKDGGV